ncbi:hypothetical protein Y032_0005g2522 [Ancylostoma ceylanicum]|nr:hypothetical protein Y032_0005g2522 [Ancylostoma ceylanicum]
MSLHQESPLSDSAEFCLAAAYAVALHLQERNRSNLSYSDSFSESTTIAQRCSSGRSTFCSDLSSQGFIPDFSSTPYRCDDVAQSVGDEADMEESDLNLINEEADRRNGVNLTLATSMESTFLNSVRSTATSRRRGDTYKTLRSKEFWQQMIVKQSHWME